MKKLIIISLSIITLQSFLVSCTDAIDIDQPGILPLENAFETVSDLQLGLLGSYSLIDGTPQIQFNSVFTDEIAIGIENGGQGLGDNTYGFELNPTSAFPTALWTRFYGALNQINRIISVSENIEVPDEDVEEFNDIRGQLFGLRAYCHFQLHSYYSEDYEDPNALSAIVFNFPPPEEDIVNFQLPRNTNAEMYAAILEDLTVAEGLLSDQINSSFVSIDFTLALRARLEAYRGNYGVADALAADLLTRYDLADRDQYTDMYLNNDDDVTEVIFELTRQRNDNFDQQGTTGSAFAGGWVGAIYAFGGADIDGAPYFEMGRSLFNTIDSDDIRFDVLLNPTSLIDPDYLINQDPTTDVLLVGKYPGKTEAGQDLLNDIKVFRASEMVLIRAEAAADSGNLSMAANFIDMLRDARFGSDQTAPVFGSEQEAFGAILDERRIELAFEGHRYRDLKRLGVRGNRIILKDPVDCAVNSACDLPSTDFRFTNPVPLVELNGNDVVQQTTGY